MANLFARTEKKVGTVPTCSRRIFSPTNFNQSRCRILVFASRRANKFAKWKTGLTRGTLYNFNRITELIESVNAAMKKELGNTNIMFSLNLRTHKVNVAFAKKHYIALYRQLAKMLGYGGEYIKVRKSSESLYVLDLHDIASIFVYCNIVQTQIVGNTSVPLPRTIAVSGKSGDVITKTFNNIQYVPVQTKSFENIQILLRTNTGNPVPFEHGKVIATLYFRKLSYFD